MEVCVPFFARRVNAQWRFLFGLTIIRARSQVFIASPRSNNNAHNIYRSNSVSHDFESAAECMERENRFNYTIYFILYMCLAESIIAVWCGFQLRCSSVQIYQQLILG
jgi:hypothetical protein